MDSDTTERLTAAGDGEYMVKSGSEVLWQGVLTGGHLVRLNPARFSFDAEAFDLLSKQLVRFITLDIVSLDGDVGGETPILRFAGSKTFNAYGRDLDASELTRSGGSLLHGWSHIEPWGVWTDGHAAHIVLRPEGAARSYEVALDMHAYVPPEDPVRNVRMQINNRLLGDLEFKYGQGMRELRFRFAIEPGEELLNFRFEIQNAVSPAMLSRRSDGCLLGVGLTGFRLNRLEEYDG